MVTKLQIAGKLKFYSKPYGRQWKWRYQTHGHIMEPQLNVPKKLKNVKIIDPLNPEKLPKKQTEAKWHPSTRHPLLEPFFSAASLESHPNYQEKAIKLFDRNCKFHAGIQQASLLTKTKAVQGLPEKYNTDKNYALMEDNNTLVEAYIRQALAYTPTKVVCPRLKIPSDVKFMIAREYATPHSEQMRILFDNLIRLCTINTNRKCKHLITDRKLLQQVALSTIVTRGEDDLLIRRNSEFGLFTKQQPKPLANESEIQATKDFQFLDMYPIFPTIDLIDEHIYAPDENTFGWKQATGVFPNLHTLFHVNDDGATDEANIARLMMFAFGAGVSQAKILKANNKLELNADQSLRHPLVVNGVSISESHRLNYVAFQLNTMNLKDNEGVRNLCYYDMNNELYFNRPTVNKLPYPTHKNIQRMAIRELEYNPETFKKLQSIVACGAN